VEGTKVWIIYYLMKHSQFPPRQEQEDKPGTQKIIAATLLTSFFFEELE